MRDYTVKSCELTDEAMDRLGGIRHARDWWKDACEKALARKEELASTCRQLRRQVAGLKGDLARYKREVNNLNRKLAERGDVI